LLLAPGGVQIFYGDETARPLGVVPASDPQQATRSDMNWSGMDTAVLDHWRRLGRFRARHVALAHGEHRQIAAEPYTFSRIDRASGDRVVVALGLTVAASVTVQGVFADGDTVRDAFSGHTYKVRGGTVQLPAAMLTLLEAANPPR
jgi:alpha-amylase